jgi:hypothetical protein
MMDSNDSVKKKSQMSDRLNDQSTDLLTLQVNSGVQSVKYNSTTLAAEDLFDRQCVYVWPITTYKHGGKGKR